MVYRFNPFTGRLDLVEVAKEHQAPVLNSILIKTIENGALVTTSVITDESTVLFDEVIK